MKYKKAAELQSIANCSIAAVTRYIEYHIVHLIQQSIDIGVREAKHGYNFSGNVHGASEIEMMGLVIDRLVENGYTCEIVDLVPAQTTTRNTIGKKPGAKNLVIRW